MKWFGCFVWFLGSLGVLRGFLVFWVLGFDFCVCGVGLVFVLVVCGLYAWFVYFVVLLVLLLARFSGFGVGRLLFWICLICHWFCALFIYFWVWVFVFGLFVFWVL